MKTLTKPEIAEDIFWEKRPWIAKEYGDNYYLEIPMYGGDMGNNTTPMVRRYKS